MNYETFNKIRMLKAIEKSIPKKLKNKQVIRSQNKVAVDVSQPVYTDDRSRFFKASWEEEKKQLYFK